MLKELREGYTTGNTMMNHLFMFGDLKIFGKSKRQVESLVNTVHRISKDVGSWSVL